MRDDLRPLTSDLRPPPSPFLPLLPVRVLTPDFQLLTPGLTPVPVPNWPIQSRASQCALANQVKIPWEMQAFLGRIIFLLVNYGLFMRVGHHRARGLPTCTRLKKMHATACIKVGNLRSGLRPLREGMRDEG